MIIASRRRGIAENKAYMRTFNPLTLDIVLSGLSTRTTLSDVKLKALFGGRSYIYSVPVEPSSTKSSKLNITIAKSRTFQESLR